MITQSVKNENTCSAVNVSFVKAIVDLKISKLLTECNIRKNSRKLAGEESGAKRSAFEVFQFLLMIAFEGYNLYRFLGSRKQDIACSKSTYHRFLNDCHYNWRRFVTKLASRVISYFDSLTCESRFKAFVLDDSVCQKKYGAKILKPVQAYKMYRKIVKYFATRTLMEYCKTRGVSCLTLDLITKIREMPLYTEWENVGGQIIPSQKVQELFDSIKAGKINDWEEVHAFYNLCQVEYEQYKVRYSLYLLERLYSRPIEQFSFDLYRNISDDVTVCAFDIYNAAFGSREKDYTDYYRNMVYRSQKEMDAVIGPLNDNSFLKELRADTAKFAEDIKGIFSGLCEK